MLRASFISSYVYVECKAGYMVLDLRAMSRRIQGALVRKRDHKPLYTDWIGFSYALVNLEYEIWQTDVEVGTLVDPSQERV